MRQYRLLEIRTQYDQYIREFYKAYGNTDGLSYDELYKIMADDAFGESDFIHSHLNKMGIETKSIICNNRNLQDKWCPHKDDMSYFDILLMQIKDFRPDIILMLNMAYFSQKETLAIKECMGKTARLVGFYFSSLTDLFKKNAMLYDQVYTGNNIYVRIMRDWGLPAYLLRHAFEPDIINRIPRCDRNNEICFPGSIMVGTGDCHNNRLDMLDVMTRSGVPYTFYGEIYGSVQNILACEDGVKYLEIIARGAGNIKKSVFGIKYFSILNQYGICLNIHGLSVENGGSNMRMFEATGMGTCLLTDNRSDNAELFDVGKEIVVYDSFEDMVEKAKWLLSDPKSAREIALAGQKKTFSKHTFKNKAECLNEYIQKMLD